MALPPVVAELKAQIGEFKAKMGEAGEEVQHLAHKSAPAFDKVAAVGKGALLGLGGAAIAVGGMSLEMADKFEVSHARLEVALRNSGGNMEELKPRIDSVSKQMEHFGFTNTETEEALARLTTATGSPAKALDQMGLAADLARARNISLSDASDLLGKAMTGNLRPLKQMGIDLPITASNALKLQTANDNLTKAQDGVNKLLQKYPDAANPASKAHAQYEAATAKVTAAQKKLSAEQTAGGSILDTLSKKFAGQAAQSADTFAGKEEVLKAKLEDTGKNIGLVLIPIIERLIGVTGTVVTWLEKHSGVAKALAITVGVVLGGAIAAYVASLAIAVASSVAGFAAMIAKAAVWVATNGAAAAAGAAQWLAGGAAMVASAAASGAVWLAENAARLVVWVASNAAAAASTLLAWLPAMAAMLASAVATAVAMLIAWAPLLLGLAAIGIVAYELYKHWDAVWGFIKKVAQDAWDYVLKPLFLILAAAFWPWAIALYELYKHWDLVWGLVKKVAAAAWDDVLKPVFHWIVELGIGYLKAELKLLQVIWQAVWGAIVGAFSAVWDGMKVVFGWLVDKGLHLIRDEVRGLQVIWQAVWGAISGAFSAVWDGMKAVFHFVVDNGLHLIRDEVAGLQRLWSDAWGAIGGAISWVWNTIIRPVVDAVTGAVDRVKNAVSSIGGALGGLGSAVGGVGKLLGFDEGGYVPGPSGAARLAVVHGGEYVLSRDMLTGRQPVHSSLAAGGTGGGAALAGGGVHVHPGAVQLTVQGDVTVDVLPRVQGMLDSAMGELVRELASARAA